jgi:hypothetical protein
MPGPIALRRPRASTDGTHDQHPPARDEMLQVVRQALDVFAGLLLEALHCDDLRDQHAVGLTDRLSGHVRRPRKTPIRHRVQRPADDVPIPRHQTLKVLGELRRAQLKPHDEACHSWLNRNRGMLLELASGLIAFEKAHAAAPSPT